MNLDDILPPSPQSAWTFCRNPQTRCQHVPQHFPCEFADAKQPVVCFHDPPCSDSTVSDSLAHDQVWFLIAQPPHLRWRPHELVAQVRFALRWGLTINVVDIEALGGTLSFAQARDVCHLLPTADPVKLSPEVKTWLPHLKMLHVPTAKFLHRRMPLEDQARFGYELPFNPYEAQHVTGIEAASWAKLPPGVMWAGGSFNRYASRVMRLTPLPSTPGADVDFFVRDVKLVSALVKWGNNHYHWVVSNQRERPAVVTGLSRFKQPNVQIIVTPHQTLRDLVRHFDFLHLQGGWESNAPRTWMSVGSVWSRATGTARAGWSISSKLARVRKLITEGWTLGPRLRLWAHRARQDFTPPKRIPVWSDQPALLAAQGLRPYTAGVQLQALPIITGYGPPGHRLPGGGEVTSWSTDLERRPHRKTTAIGLGTKVELCEFEDVQLELGYRGFQVLVKKRQIVLVRATFLEHESLGRLFDKGGLQRVWEISFNRAMIYVNGVVQTHSFEVSAQARIRAIGNLVGFYARKLLFCPRVISIYDTNVHPQTRRVTLHPSELCVTRK